MYIRNLTDSYQAFNHDGRRYELAPKMTNGCDMFITDDFKPSIRELLERKAIEIVKEKPEKIEPPKPPKEKMKVVPADQNVTNQTRLVPCNAIKADGTQCNVNVPVPIEEYDPEKPYFCNRHKRQNPDDYTKVEGKWVKKAD